MIDDERYLTKVQKLMREKNYAEARRILVLLDHPTAHLWLARLDEIQAEMGLEKAKPRSRTFSRPVMIVLITLSITFVLGLGAVISLLTTTPDGEMYTGNWGFTHENPTAIYWINLTSTSGARTEIARRTQAASVGASGSQIAIENMTAFAPLLITATADMRLRATETP